MSSKAPHRPWILLAVACLSVLAGLTVCQFGAIGITPHTGEERGCVDCGSQGSSPAAHAVGSTGSGVEHDDGAGAAQPPVGSNRGDGAEGAAEALPASGTKSVSAPKQGQSAKEVAEEQASAAFPYDTSSIPAEEAAFIRRALNPEPPFPCANDARPGSAECEPGVVMGAIAGYADGAGDRVRGLRGTAVIAVQTQRRLVVDHRFLAARTPPDMDWTLGEKHAVLTPPGIHYITTYNEKRCEASQWADIAALPTNTTLALHCNCESPPMIPGAPEALQEASKKFWNGRCNEGAFTDYSRRRALRAGQPRELGQYQVHSGWYKCGAAILLSAWKENPTAAAKLASMNSLHDAWLKLVAPDGFSVLHIRAGGSSVPLAAGQGKAVAWEDGKVSPVPGMWVQHFRSTYKDLMCRRPLMLITDSTRVRAELEAASFNALSIPHCCTAPLHVGLIEREHIPEQTHQAELQVIFDMFTLAKADTAVISVGGFSELGKAWMSFDRKADTHRCEAQACFQGVADKLRESLQCSKRTNGYF